MPVPIAHRRRAAVVAALSASLSVAVAAAVATLAAPAARASAGPDEKPLPTVAKTVGAFPARDGLLRLHPDPARGRQSRPCGTSGR